MSEIDIVTSYLCVCRRVRRKNLGFVRYVLRCDDSAKTVESGIIWSGLGSFNSGDAVGEVEGCFIERSESDQMVSQLCRDPSRCRFAAEQQLDRFRAQLWTM